MPSSQADLLLDRKSRVIHFARAASRSGASDSAASHQGRYRFLEGCSQAWAADHTLLVQAMASIYLDALFVEEP